MKSVGIPELTSGTFSGSGQERKASLPLSLEVNPAGGKDYDGIEIGEGESPNVTNPVFGG